MIKVEHWPNGNIKRIKVRDEKKRAHNLNGPAVQIWHENGQEQYRAYWVEGKRHNPHGPAWQRWYENGQEESRSYWVDEKQHNLNGPSFQSWYRNGQAEYREYWVDGKEFTEAEFEALPHHLVEVTCGDKTVRIRKSKAIKLGLIDKPKTTRRTK